MSNEYYAQDPHHTANRELFAAGVAVFGKEAERKHWECIHAFRLRREENPKWLPLRGNGPHWSTATEYRRRADAPAIFQNEDYAHNPEHTENRKLFEEGAAYFGEEAERAHWECVPIHRLLAEQNPNWSPLSSSGPNWFLGTAYRRRADAPAIPQKEPINVEIEIEIDHTPNRRLFAQGVAAFGEEAECKNWECVDAYKLRTEKHPRWRQLGFNGPHWFSDIAYRRSADAPTIFDTGSPQKPEDRRSPDPETTPNWKIEAWRSLSHHPFFEGCEDDVGDRKDSLVEVMLGRLDRASEVFATSAYKYADTLSPFVDRMVQELYANSGKDRSGWRSMSAEEAMLELHYHVAKLQKAALKEENRDAIFEYAADVANLAMMVADVSGCLGEPESPKANRTSESDRPATRSSVYYALAAARSRGVKEVDLFCVLRSFVLGRLSSPEGYVNHLQPEHFAEVTKYLNAL